MILLAAVTVVMFAVRWQMIYLLVSKALDMADNADAAKILETAATLRSGQRK